MGEVGNQCMRLSDEILDRPAREVVRIMDAMENENGCLYENSVENYDFIDKEARNVLQMDCQW